MLHYENDDRYSNSAFMPVVWSFCNCFFGFSWCGKHIFLSLCILANPTDLGK